MEALFPLPFIVAVRARASALKSALAECGTFLVPFIPTAIFAYLLMGLVWPWSVVSPLNPFRAVEYFSTVFEKPWRELFAGQLIPVDDMPRSYVPTLFAVQVPELMLLLGLCGLAGVLIFIVRSADNSSAGAGRRAAFLSVALAATLPILIAVMTRPVVYNGIRHIVFVLPPFAVLGGLAATWIWQRLQAYGRTAVIAGGLALLAGLASPVVDMVRLHPYEYTDYNHLAGGVPGARKDFMLDYWGLSFKQASQKLAAYTQTQSAIEARQSVEGCCLRPASAGRGGARQRSIQHRLGSEGRRFRHGARRVLLRQARCAGAVQRGPRGRHLCPRL